MYVAPPQQRMYVAPNVGSASTEELQRPQIIDLPMFCSHVVTKLWTSPVTPWFIYFGSLDLASFCPQFSIIVENLEDEFLYFSLEDSDICL